MGVVSRLLVTSPRQGLMDTSLQPINLCKASSHQSFILFTIPFLLKYCVLITAIKMAILCQIIILSTTKIMILY